jgi:hypothetical protein
LGDSIVMDEVVVMENESLISIIFGGLLVTLAFAWAGFDPDAPTWFLSLLGCVGAWLITLPLCLGVTEIRGGVNNGSRSNR